MPRRVKKGRRADSDDDEESASITAPVIVDMALLSFKEKQDLRQRAKHDKKQEKQKCFVCNQFGHSRKACPGIEDGGRGQSRHKAKGGGTKSSVIVRKRDRGSKASCGSRDDGAAALALLGSFAPPPPWVDAGCDLLAASDPWGASGLGLLPPLHRARCAGLAVPLLSDAAARSLLGAAGKQLLAAASGGSGARGGSEALLALLGAAWERRMPPPPPEFARLELRSAADDCDDNDEADEDDGSGGNAGGGAAAAKRVSLRAANACPALPVCYMAGAPPAVAFAYDDEMHDRLLGIFAPPSVTALPMPEEGGGGSSYIRGGGGGSGLDDGSGSCGDDGERIVVGVVSGSGARVGDVRCWGPVGLDYSGCARLPSPALRGAAGDGVPAFNLTDRGGDADDDGASKAEAVGAGVGCATSLSWREAQVAALGRQLAAAGQLGIPVVLTLRPERARDPEG